MLNHFKKWETLCGALNRGSLALIDLIFAQSVLKKLGSVQEEHATLLAVLFALSRQGHLMLDLSPEGLELAWKLLGVEETRAFSTLVCKGAETFPADAPEGKPSAWVCRQGQYFYLQKNWVYESEILAHLERLSKSLPSPFQTEEVDSKLNALQKEAVEKGMQNAFSLLTGGPGTGKTFTAAELVKACLFSLSPEQRKQYRIIITAPTGKAVAHLEGNLRRAIGEEAQIHSGTLHSVLGIKAHSHHEEIQPLFADLVIVDECSMIDAKIFSRLLGAVSTGMRLVLIGDKDQLPPVESGSVFADLIDLKVFPSTCLTESLRSDRVEILTLAKAIRDGNVGNALTSLSMNAEIEWTDLEEENLSMSQVYAELWQRCKERFPSVFAEKPTAEQILSKLGTFSILSCMRRGSLGVDAVNSYFLHQYLRQAAQGNWWVAPIMVTRNDHELQLFNGDLGFVVRKMDPNFSFRQFDRDDYALFLDRKSASGFRELSALALNAFEYSYCLSVHKSQGSEYEEVLILVPEGSESFGREVLYTAVTRARRKVSLAGSKAILRRSIETSSRKMSGIISRLKNLGEKN
jgi:exodeoxyribonuclease V alpha subunit